MAQVWNVGIAGVIVRTFFVKRRAGESSASLPPPPAPIGPGVALVVGATTAVGTSLVDALCQADTPGGPWQLHAVSPDPPVVPDGAVVHHVAVADPSSSSFRDSLSEIAGELTNVFYVAGVEQPALLQAVLAAVVHAAPQLRHVGLLTGRMHYIGAHEAPFREEMPTVSPSCFQAERLLADAVRAKNVRWTVHRPSTEFGFTPPRGGVNLVATLCVYAAICRKERRLLKWPGGEAAWQCLTDASDADLVAEHLIWAAVEPDIGSGEFNCSNGDVFRWKSLWPRLAELFDVAPAGYTGDGERFLLEEAMAGKEGVWNEIVTEYGLNPTSIGDVADWGHADEVLNAGGEHINCMNKSREHEFPGFRSTEKVFVQWIEKLKEHDIVP